MIRVISLCLFVVLVARSMLVDAYFWSKGRGRGDDRDDRGWGKGWGRGRGCNNATKVNNTCPEPAIGEQTCTYNRQGDPGIWVCRTFFEPTTGDNETMSYCASPDYALDTDVCGCCGSTCPEPCSCSCDLEEEGDGLGVLVEAEDKFDEEETFVRCMNSTKAYHKITKSYRYSCVTNCTR